MIDTKELRAVIQEIGLNGVCLAEINELLDRLEAAEKECDALRAAARHEADCVEAAMAEINSLRAKIEAMERQEPVGWQRLYRDGSGSEDFTDLPHVFERQRPLYALPGAQPAPSVPDTHNDMVMGLDYQGAMSCARQRANQEAGLLYPEGDARKEEMERELAGEYYRQYTTPNQGAKP